MPRLDLKKIYAERKRRVLGEVMKEAEVKSQNAWLRIHGSSKELLVTYESKGLVVAINGSGSLELGHTVCREASLLAEYIKKQGGIVLNGGRNTGVMEATSCAAGDQSLGVIFPEIEKQANKYGMKMMVNAPTPRIELLGTCAPIMVIFRGGLGSLMMLMRAIVHTRNRVYHPEQPPQLVFVSTYWIGLLNTMLNLGCLPREFLTELNFFDNADKIIEKIPSLKI
jgi:predicted Rossmann-fold nucleotide-binding protein